MDTKLMFSSSNQEWRTPIELYKKLDDIFHFTIDLAASDWKLCQRYYTKLNDCLQMDWKNEIGFLNPPYSREQGKFIRKAAEEGMEECTVVCLIPARPDTQLWQDVIFKKASAIVFIKGRIKFEDGETSNSAPFPSALVIFGDIGKRQLKRLEEFGKVVEI